MKTIPIFSIILSFLVFFSSGCKQSVVVHREVRNGVYHTVERHQTLWRICKTYGVDIEMVAAKNAIKDKNKINVGQRIFIPGAKKVLKVGVYIEDVTARTRKSTVRYEKGRFLWPVKGQVTATFGKASKRKHEGIDIYAPLGTPIRAADRGKVVYSDNKIRGYGNLIIIEHKDGFFTIYAHNQVNLVQEEVRVERGDVIAKVGNTGNAAGSHLHFEIRKGSKPLDPIRFLN